MDTSIATRLRAPIGSASRTSNNSRVFNVTRGYSLKHSQALKAVGNCVCAWVEFGISVRDLTLAESIEMRHRQIKPIEHLPLSEQPGLIWQPPAGHESTMRTQAQLVREANQFLRN